MGAIIAKAPHGGPRRRSSAAVALAAALLVAACSADVNVRGSVIDMDRVAQIKPGVQTRRAVRDLLGPPTNLGTFGDKTWYYISQTDARVAFSRTTPLSRNIVSVTFDDSGRVAAVKRYTLEDGKEVEFSRRKTRTPGREFSLLQQLIGNLGRFEGSGSAPNVRPGP